MRRLVQRVANTGHAQSVFLNPHPAGARRRDFLRVRWQGFRFDYRIKFPKQKGMDALQMLIATRLGISACIVTVVCIATGSLRK